jgi:Putative beta-lactamase-inhibitor-like, PepSY-like
MKRITFFAALLVVTSLSANAQKMDAAKLPAPVTAAFAKQFPGADARWDKEDLNYEAGFKQNGQNMSVLFDANGTVIETEVDIKVSTLPADVLNYVKEHYKGKTIKEGAKITKADGTITYEAEVAGKDLIFDAAGKFIK